jgi:hypothetical protein
LNKELILATKLEELTAQHATAVEDVLRQQRGATIGVQKAAYNDMVAIERNRERLLVQNLDLIIALLKAAGSSCPS